MTSHFKRALLIVLDGVGVGALPDAKLYGDDGANTLLHCSDAVGGLPLPVLDRLGLARILPRKGASFEHLPEASFGKLREASPGKDTMTGHWEMTGLVLNEQFPTFTGGIPPAILEAFHGETGYEPLGGHAASGTEILESLGPEHLRSGRPIVYTSADSVFQITTHLDIFPLHALYALCRKARRVTTPYRIARVIARPFLGQPGAFRRTEDRKDFALPPPSPTLLDRLTERGVPVLGIGKIYDLFSGHGITLSKAAGTNTEVLNQIRLALHQFQTGLVFANLNDFDSLYGHRRNPQGYARALEQLDSALPDILERLDHQDLLILTSDHGCDPTFHGTDHTREYALLLVYRKGAHRCDSLGIRETFSDLAATLAEAFSIPWPGPGTSFFSSLTDR